MATPQQEHREVENLPLLVISVMLATLMQVVDMTIANVALPHMQGSLSATQDQVSWVLTSYIVAAAIATPATGWLTSTFGRKNVLMASIVGFTGASVLCAMSTSITQMVVFRVLQGLFGASLSPISQSSLLDSFPREKHGAAMAMWGMGIMVGPILGPPLGGWLTENYSWHWVFLINVPLGLLALIGVMASMPQDPHHKSRFDWRGFAFLTVGIAALQLMLDRGNQKDWFGSVEIQVELALALLGFYLYWVHWRDKRNPFVELGLLRDRNFSAAVIFMFSVGIVLLATVSLLPPYMQTLMNYPVITTGLLMAPRGVGTLVSMTLVGRLMARGVDPRAMVVTGVLLTAYSLYMMSGFNAEVPAWPIINSGIVQGLGLGLIFVPVSTMAYTTLPMAARTEAASIYNLVRNIGSSVGISIVFTLVARNTQINHAEIASRITPYGTVPLPATIHTPAGLAALNGEVTRQAAAISYINDFWLMMWLMLATLPLILLFRLPKRRRNLARPPADDPVIEHADNLPDH
ncbi:MAG TPA: DHA2 family efflux MFS transporter permease subunit [Rhodanobacteraceae bacterium]|nr:DHA2 family efflux MFS transporter permease subunit [Rhodanobacteraceae bacterium]